MKKKIKILRIITRLNIGGPAIHTALLTKELDNGEFESTLLCGSVSKGEGDMGYAAELYGVKPVFVPLLKRAINPLMDALAFYRIFRFMRKYKPDIVHTHTAKAGTLGRLAAVLANVPVKVHTFHGNVFHGYFNKKSTKFFVFLERILARFTDAVITISPSQREEAIHKYRITEGRKCHVIRLGFELGKFLNSAEKRNFFRKRFRFRDDDILVGTVGRFVSIKNHKMFIKAIDHINKTAGKEMADRLKFIIVGGGELKPELLAYTKFKRLEKKIFFMGWMKDIDEVYAGLDIVTLTSVNEGTPVSLIEAMTSSRPVVSTDVGGVKDAVAGCGVLVESGDYSAMGEKILELASSVEKREELGARGRESVREAYSKKRLVSELSGLYRNLLSKKKGRAG